MNKYRVTGWRRIDLEYEAVVEAKNAEAAERYVEEDYEEYRTQENTDGYEWVSTEIWNGKWQILRNSNEKQKERLASELIDFVLWNAEIRRRYLMDWVKERCAELRKDHEYAERHLAAELIEMVGEEVVPHKIDFVLWAAECSWNNQADVEAFLESRKD